MRLTVAQLKRIILEGLDLLPPRQQVENQLQDAKFDRDAGARALSKIDRAIPPAKRLLMQQLSRALMMWQNDKAGWQAVTTVLDKIYAEPEPRRSSYIGMKAVNRASERPKVA